MFRERGKEGERGEKHRCERETSIGCLSHASSWGLGHNPGMCSAWELSWLPFVLRDEAQPTEPHWSGPSSPNTATMQKGIIVRVAQSFPVPSKIYL